MKGRKKEHLEISINENVQGSYNYWDDVILLHNALPEIDMREIDTTWKEFGKEMKAPIIIAGMTGGFKEAEIINESLAQIAEKYQIGMGVGSQRAGLEDEKVAKSYSIINKCNIPLKIANVGAPQLLEWKEPIKMAERAVEMIEADALAIHLNFLQESVQVEGDRVAKGCLQEIGEVASSLSTPVIVKETGAGISYNVAKKLLEIDIAGIDIGGMGGTSFAAIEAYRAKKRGDKIQEELGHIFWDWGIPTPYSLIEVAEICKDVGMVIIATGGVRNGLDVARALALGADAAGIASAFITSSSAEEKMELCMRSLKTAMFLTGCRSIKELKDVEAWVE